MKSNSLQINCNRIKQIPKGAVGFWIVLAFVVLYCTIQLCHPMYQTLDDLQNREINIDQVNLLDSHDTKGSRLKLEIVSGKTTYYVWYPQSKYIDYSHDVENDLLTRKISSVKVKIANTQSMRDSLFNQKRVVDIRSDSAVYYDLNTEMIRMQHHHRSLWILCIFTFLFLLCYTMFISFIYRVLVFKKK